MSLLLAVDVGNTNMVLGVFREETLIEEWRLRTIKERTADEYVVLFRDLFQLRQISIQEITDIIVACVVPPILPVFTEAAVKGFGIKPMVLGPGLKSGMPIYYDNPKEVGADRIANGVAAYEKYRRAIVVVDFGTATTFDYISPEGEYRGGVICPGIAISLEALSEHAAKLPKIEMQRPKRVVGKNTVSSMQSGIIFGYVGLVDEIVNRIREEVGTDPVAVATGGLANLIAPECKTISALEPFLTLEGLRIIYQRNRS